MEYIDHDHKHTVKRGGSIMSGSSNYDDNIVLDTPEYSRHDLSHSWKGTAKCGTINAVLNLHVLPGDSLRFSPTFSQKFRPLVNPIISQLESTEHTFYVPYRLCDYSFEKQLTGGVSGTFQRNLLHFNLDTTTITQFTSVFNNTLCFGVPLFKSGSLLDQMNFGITSEKDSSTGVYVDSYLDGHSKFSSLSLVAYHRIYNDYYRAKEVETDLWCHTEPEAKNLFSYFTTLMTALQDIVPTITGTGVQICTTPIVEGIYTALRTRSEFTGFCEFMLWLLTSPDAIPVVQSFYTNNYPSGQQVATYDALRQRLNFKGFCLSRTAMPSAAESIKTAYYIDFFSAVFAIYLLSPEFFPWERDRATTALPYLLRGNNVALETAIMAATSSATLSFGSSSPDGLFKLEGYDYHLQNGASGSEKAVATGFTIEELRRVNALTKFLERNARIGYVFDEWLEGFFGISTKRDNHLSKPSYIGGSKYSADIETIMSQSETDLANIGDYRGYASSFGDGSFDFSVPEHGVIIGCFATKPRVSYLNVFDRNNAKFGNRTLFFTPDFAYLSEQPLFTAEFEAHQSLSSLTNWLNDDWLDEDEYESLEIGYNCFGYEPRYNEYRSCFDTTHGELKTSLASFTTARTAYDSTVSNSEIANDVFFQHCFPDNDCVNRIFQVDATMADHFVLSTGWKIDALRLVPRQATPKL